jgi:hypothetical protein
MGKILQMAFLNDLDPWAWGATLAAVGVCFAVTFANVQDFRDHRRLEIFDGRGTLIAFFGGCFLVGAFHSYSFNAHAARKTVEGVARFVGKSSGRGGFDEYVCATSCQLTGGYALDLHDEASGPVRLGSKYVFTYFERPRGSVLNGISLRVIAVADPDSGRVLYALDLANHPYRIALYLLDFTLVVLSGAVGVFLNRTHHFDDSEESTPNEDESDDEEPKDPETISLELGSGDTH